MINKFLLISIFMAIGIHHSISKKKKKFHFSYQILNVAILLFYFILSLSLLSLGMCSQATTIILIVLHSKNKDFTILFLGLIQNIHIILLCFHGVLTTLNICFVLTRNISLNFWFFTGHMTRPKSKSKRRRWESMTLSISFFTHTYKLR